MFTTRLVNAVEGLRATMNIQSTGRVLADLVRLAIIDLEPLRPHGFRHSDAVKYWLRRRPRPGSR
jgi:hypothetical protein